MLKYFYEKVFEKLFPRVFDCVFVRQRARTDTSSFKINVAVGAVIKFDNTSSRRGFAATRLADKPENFAFFDVETDVVDGFQRGLTELEILRKMLDFQKDFFIVKIIAHFVLLRCRFRFLPLFLSPNFSFFQFCPQQSSAYQFSVRRDATAMLPLCAWAKSQT